MPEILDLPNELLPLIWRELPLGALISTCRVSRRIHESSLSYLCHAFQKSSAPERTRKRLRHFFQLIKKYPFVRPHVRSIIIDDMRDDRSILTLRSLIVPLLSFLPNLQKLAIPGHLRLLSSLRTAIGKGTVSLNTLQELRCVECDPKIWEILSYLPQLRLLSLKNLPLDQSILQLSAGSLSIQAILFENCDFISKAICAVIESCKRLTSFQYLCSSQRRFPLPKWFPWHPYLDVGEIHEALLLHKDSLEELVIQSHNYAKPYDQIPKFGSFEDFTSLTRLGIDYYNISRELFLPPALNSVAVKQCSKQEAGSTAEVPLVLLYLGKHPSLKTISIDDMPACLFFLNYQGRGYLRKEIQLHTPSPFDSWLGELDCSNLVAHPLPWIGHPEVHFPHQ